MALTSDGFIISTTISSFEQRTLYLGSEKEEEIC